MFFKQTLFFAYLIIANIVTATNSPTKRGVFDTSFEGNDFNSFNVNPGFGASFLPLPPHQVLIPKPLILKKIYNTPSASISTAEIASAIQAAKEASASVQAAQQRVQDAKDAVLHQQHLANHKQAQAALALQKTEAAAAVQQQEAKSAATSVIQAQQRLAHAKAEVAELQRIASVKEGHAAEIIDKSAAVAAAEVQKNDDVARKISALQHSRTATLKQVAAAKDGSLSAASVAVAASIDHSGNGGGAAWDSAPKFVHIHPWG